MTSATTGLALRLDSVPEADLPLISLFPALLTQTGVIDNGKPIPYEQMTELLRKQVLSLDANFSVNVRSNRVELVVQGSGNDLAESRRAIEWMRLVLAHPGLASGESAANSRSGRAIGQPPALHHAGSGRVLGDESRAGVLEADRIRSISRQPHF